MSLNTWLMYSLAMLVLTAAPGPSVLLCVSKSVTSGFNAAVYAALGSTLAIVGIITLSFSGLGLVLATSDMAFSIVKWCGVFYLVYLGLKAFMSPGAALDSSSDNTEVAAALPSRRSNFASGFLVGGSNPKAIVFFSALFPQFIDQSGSMLFQYTVFVLTFVAFEMCWLMIYAVFGERSSRWWREPGRLVWFNRVTGGLFIGAGALLAASTRASARVS